MLAFSFKGFNKTCWLLMVQKIMLAFKGSNKTSWLLKVLIKHAGF